MKTFFSLVSFTLFTLSASPQIPDTCKTINKQMIDEAKNPGSSIAQLYYNTIATQLFWGK